MKIGENNIMITIITPRDIRVTPPIPSSMGIAIIHTKVRIR